MSLEKIIDHVRKEDVVLWLGSGFSRYAGYPTGENLTALLLGALSTEERESINPGLPLLDLTEQFVRLKGGSRNQLNQLLRKEFTRKPSSLKWHQALAKVPHIRTIITTNYDQLIEQGYGNDLSPVIGQPDLAYLDGRTELFKVHGDILHPDSIIITRTDYTNLFRHDAPNNLLWATIKSRLANKTLVFVGYDMEDENVKVTLQSVAEELGKNRKEIFLIAPGFKKYKIQYLSQFQIQYVDSKGEVFLEKLLTSLKANIVTDFHRGLVSADTFRKFCHIHNLSVELQSKKDGFDLKGIAAISASFGSHVSFKLKNDATATSLNKILSGKQFGEISIDSPSLEGLKLLLNEVSILSEDTEYRLVFTSPPGKQGSVNVTFDDRTEFDNIEFQVFRSKSLFEVRASYSDSKYVFQFDPAAMRAGDSTSNFSFEPPSTFKNVNQAVNSFLLAIKIVNGIGFTVYPEAEDKSFHLQTSESEFQLPPLESNLRFFESLKKIEQAYGIRFQNFSSYSKNDFNNALKAATFAGGEPYYQDWPNELQFPITKDTPLELIQKIEEDATLTAFAQKKEVLMIYGHPIDLGYQVIEGEDLYIANRPEIERGETAVALLRSKSQKVKFYYRQNLPGEADDTNK